jgi:hypothetical protein
MATSSPSRAGRSSTSADREWPDPGLPQDPGIPGEKTPEELPPQEEPEVARVPDSEQPDVDDEGEMAPNRRDVSG